MAQPLGISFQPGMGNGNGAQTGAAPLQRAVQLLSLRLPSVVGARAIAPQALLQGQGGAGFGGGMPPEAAIALLQRLLAQSGGSGLTPYLGGRALSRPFAPMPTGAPSIGTSPTPRIIPGGEDNQRGSGIGEPTQATPNERKPTFTDRYGFTPS